MFRRILILAHLALAAAHAPAATCREVQIPVTVTTPRFNINLTIHDDWDAAALTLSLTRRDAGFPDDPLPVSGTVGPVTATYQIGATLCGTGGSTLILTHGIIESKLYWQPNLPNSNDYNFVSAAVEAGYSVLSYDRIGVGSSSRVDALQDAQFQVEVAVLNALIEYTYSVENATKVALIGHSYGSYISSASASQVGVEGLVLTGFSGSFDYFKPFLAGASLRVAKTLNPARWGQLNSSYLTTADLYSEAYIYFAEPYFEHRIARWAFDVASEPFALAELPSLLSTDISFEDVTAPVLILQGQFDVSACGGNCIGQLVNLTRVFNNSKVVETVDDLPAGHNLNLHKIAPTAFSKIFRFLKAQGV
ncbi:alpha/beta-hydrolase [Thozetella sp. PMI_491]|nr:alpha/beta-hydrolase [Thozetella sp. PMI_491]